jgi:hypothetical protein
MAITGLLDARAARSIVGRVSDAPPNNPRRVALAAAELWQAQKSLKLGFL